MESNSLIEDNNNQEVTTNTKPRFPHLKKFMGNEYEDMRMELNEMVIATNVTYEYCSIEDKPTCPWNKLHNSLYHEIDRLFLVLKRMCFCA